MPWPSRLLALAPALGSRPFWLTPGFRAALRQFRLVLIHRESSVYVSPLTLKHLSSLLIHGFVWPPKWFLAAGEKQKSAWKSK